MRNVRTGVLSALLASVLVMGGTTVASANEAAEPDLTVDELSSLVHESLPSAEIEKFEDLSATEKEQFVTVLTSEDPFAAGGIELTEESSTTQAPNSMARATTYDVTANYRVNADFLGIRLGYFHQTFRYVTGSGVVLKANSCSGTWTGFSGFWAVSQSNSKWVSGGRGYCETIFTGHVLYKGSNVSMNKRMLQIVNGPGIVSQSLNNI